MDWNEINRGLTITYIQTVRSYLGSFCLDEKLLARFHLRLGAATDVMWVIAPDGTEMEPSASLLETSPDIQNVMPTVTGLDSLYDALIASHRAASGDDEGPEQQKVWQAPVKEGRVASLVGPPPTKSHRKVVMNQAHIAALYELRETTGPEAEERTL